MNANANRGFTVVELLVVVVLGSLLLIATYQMLATNSRIYAVNNARAQGQQTLRAGSDVLFGELREISSREGDLISMEANTLTIRAQRTFGLTCTVDYTVAPAKLTVLRVGPAFEVGDSVFVFHDNDPTRSSDDEWFGGTISAVDTSATCAGRPAQTLAVPFVSSTALTSPPDSVRVGAPVRGFERWTYGQFTYAGEAYLGRWAGGSSGADPLVGPLLTSRGVGFRYLDEDSNVTTTAELVRQVEVTLRYQSPLRNIQGELFSDSTVVRVHLRN